MGIKSFLLLIKKVFGLGSFLPSFKIIIHSLGQLSLFYDIYNPFLP